MSELKLVTGSWERLAQDAKFVREQVFIMEQNISVEEEWDRHDTLSTHFVIYDQKQAIATARLLSDGHVGRVAVLKAYRGHGIGKLIMQYIIGYAEQQQRNELILSAQVHAIPFYDALGFSVMGESYLDCGIPHVDMSMTLGSTV